MQMLASAFMRLGPGIIATKYFLSQHYNNDNVAVCCSMVLKKPIQKRDDEEGLFIE
ncbi:MAG: hypothetical protein LUF78_02855 [Clostridiales bacterium]|nr:hypothetical protein [Clostridiales bacterium]